MDPQQVFCHNLDCPARGQIGKGNIVIQSQQEHLYKCNVCGQTFSERKGTLFHRRRTPEETITLVVTLEAHG
jgi:transposase-like protein